MNWNDEWNHMDGAWGWLGSLMMIGWMLLILVGIVALVVWMLRSGTGSAGSAQEPTPRDLIDTRFARGEISEDERQKMLKALS